MAADVSARVTALNRGMEFPRELDPRYGKRITALTAARHNVVWRGLFARMKPGAVVVDAAIDPGGCFDTSRPSTHADPGSGVEGVVHYGARNTPGHVARTTTSALNKANKGWPTSHRRRWVKKFRQHRCVAPRHLRHGRPARRL